MTQQHETLHYSPLTSSCLREDAFNGTYRINPVLTARRNVEGALHEASRRLRDAAEENTAPLPEVETRMQQVISTYRQNGDVYRETRLIIDDDSIIVSGPQGDLRYRITGRTALDGNQVLFDLDAGGVGALQWLVTRDGACLHVECEQADALLTASVFEPA